jgi:hypothetical protein
MDCIRIDAGSKWNGIAFRAEDRPLLAEPQNFVDSGQPGNWNENFHSTFQNQVVLEDQKRASLENQLIVHPTRRDVLGRT